MYIHSSPVARPTQGGASSPGPTCAIRPSVSATAPRTCDASLASRVDSTPLALTSRSNQPIYIIRDRGAVAQALLALLLLQDQAPSNNVTALFLDWHICQGSTR